MHAAAIFRTRALNAARGKGNRVASGCARVVPPEAQIFDAPDGSGRGHRLALKCSRESNKLHKLAPPPRLHLLFCGSPDSEADLNACLYTPRPALFRVCLVNVTS
ncbi:hypothetical protein MTO96_018506 [Rhipicephalus appendiculatus]